MGRNGMIRMATALERIAAYSGKIEPDQVIADCKEVRDQGPAQAIELMRQALTNTQIAATIAKAKRHLIKLLEGKSADAPPAQIDSAPIVSAYTQAKTEARTTLAGHAEKEQVTVTTRLVAEGCAQCHLAALELLSVLDDVSIFSDGPVASSTADTADLTPELGPSQSMIGRPTEDA